MEKDAPTRDPEDPGETSDRDARQRIAELEHQVASLKGQLAVQEGVRADGEAGSAITISRFKMILVGTITAVVILALIATIFTFLSKGFDRAAHRAAEVIAPQPEPGPGEEETGASPKQAGGEGDDAPIRPPGL